MWCLCTGKNKCSLLHDTKHRHDMHSPSMPSRDRFLPVRGVLTGAGAGGGPTAAAGLAGSDSVKACSSTVICAALGRQSLIADLGVAKYPKYAVTRSCSVFTCRQSKHLSGVLPSETCCLQRPVAKAQPGIASCSDTNFTKTVCAVLMWTLRLCRQQPCSCHTVQAACSLSMQCTEIVYPVCLTVVVFNILYTSTTCKQHVHIEQGVCTNGVPWVA